MSFCPAAGGSRRAVDVFDRIGGDDYEQVVFCHDRGSGLRASIAVHSTRRGPALGGTRFYPYAAAAAGSDDLLRLSRVTPYNPPALSPALGGRRAGCPRAQRPAPTTAPVPG